MTSQKGFTLVELLITLSVVAILVSLAAPSFSTQVKQDRLVNSANQLSSLYKFARSEAVKRAQTITLLEQNDSWLVQVTHNGQVKTLKRFDPPYESIEIGLVDRIVRSTGELNQASNILLTDKDDSTEDFRLCILQSGQSWVGEAAENCA